MTHGTATYLENLPTNAAAYDEWLRAKVVAAFTRCDETGFWPNLRMKLTAAAILVSRGAKSLQAAAAAYPERSAALLGAV